MPCNYGGRQADEQSETNLQEGGTQHHFAYVGAVRSERHTYANFAGSLRNGVCGDTIETDGRQRQRDQTEERSQLHDHLLLAEAKIYLLAEALEARDHEVGVDLLESCAYALFEIRHRAVSFEFQRAHVVRGDKELL